MSHRTPALPFWLRSLLCLTASACFFALLVALAYNIREGGDAIWLDGAIARAKGPIGYLKGLVPGGVEIGRAHV